MCFISIQVPPHLHSGPRIHVSLSPPSMSRLTSIQVPRITPLLYPCHFIHLLNFDSPPSRLCLTSIQNLIQMHKGPNMHISPPSMLRLTAIQVMRTASHLPPGLRMCVSPQSRSRLSSVQILIFVSHLDTGRISLPLRS